MENIQNVLLFSKHPYGWHWFEELFSLIRKCQYYMHDFKFERPCTLCVSSRI